MPDTCFYTPFIWREVNVIFISKPDEPTYKDTKSRPPTSLASFLLKGRERLADWFMRDTYIPRRPLQCKEPEFTAEMSSTKIGKTTSEKEYALGT